jgi:hypothetical protein
MCNSDCLYKDFNIKLEDLAEPFILDESKEIVSIDSNIERTIELTVVFPDFTLDRVSNGGYETPEEYKALLDRLKHS